MALRKHINRVKIFLYTTLASFIVLLVILGSVKYWVGPDVVRKKVVSDLSKWWDGTLHLEGIKFNFLAPQYIKVVTFSDAQGYQWGRVEDVKISLDNWLVLQPNASSIHIHLCTIQSPVNLKDTTIPLRKKSYDFKTTNAKPGLKELKIEQCSVYLTDMNQCKASLENLSFSLQQEGNFYDISLLQKEGKNLQIKGRFDPALNQTELSVKMAGETSRYETALLGNLLIGSDFYRGQGQIAVELNISGYLNKNAGPAIRGFIDLDKFTVWAGQDVYAQNLSTTLRLEGRKYLIENLVATDPATALTVQVHTIKLALSDKVRGASGPLDIEVEKLDLPVLVENHGLSIPFYRQTETRPTGSDGLQLQKISVRNSCVNIINKSGSTPNYDGLYFGAVGKQDTGKIPVSDCFAAIKLSQNHISISGISAVIFKGKLEGNSYSDYHKSYFSNMGGQLSLKDMSLADLSEKLYAAEKLSRGTAKIEYHFSAADTSLESLRAHGLIIINDADLVPVPLLAYIYNTLGFKKSEIPRLTDASIVFDMNGPIVELIEVHLSDNHSALIVEPGGTINTKTGYVDFYVVVVAIKTMDEILKKIPVIRLMVDIKDKLVRLHIKGHRTEPLSKLVRKEPITDVKEGTIGFFVGVTKSTGQLTKAMLGKTRGVFEKTKELQLKK